MAPVFLRLTASILRPIERMLCNNKVIGHFWHTFLLIFCSHNMLYPKEDRVAKKLMYVCRRCDYEEEAKTPVVFKRELVKSAR